jgi:hypothetical protein
MPETMAGRSMRVREVREGARRRQAAARRFEKTAEPPDSTLCSSLIILRLLLHVRESSPLARGSIGCGEGSRKTMTVAWASGQQKACPNARWAT